MTRGEGTQRVSFQLASNLNSSPLDVWQTPKIQTQTTCPGTWLQGLGGVKEKLAQVYKYSPRSQKKLER